MKYCYLKEDILQKRRYFIEKKVFYREKDILHKPRSSAYQTNKVNDIHATTDEVRRT